MGDLVRWQAEVLQVPPAKGAAVRIFQQRLSRLETRFPASLAG